MAELQSCASMINDASALCARSHGYSLEFSTTSAPLDCKENELKGEDINVVAEISAELQRERQKNAELMERISLLESQIQDREKASPLTSGQDVYPIATDRSFKKFKRLKMEAETDGVEIAEVSKSAESNATMKHDVPCMVLEDAIQDNCLVNWMSMDETQFLNFENFKDGDSAADCEDTDDSDDEDDESYYEDFIDSNDKDKETDDNSQVADALKGRHHEKVSNGGKNIQCLERPGGDQSEPTVLNMSHEMIGYQSKGLVLPGSRSIYNEREVKKHNRKENKKIKGYRALLDVHTTGRGIGSKGSGNLSLHKKPPKVAFCPKEVKRILELEVLLMKNAQSHTIRKIIVFASLGIRHGCEDMYELDFNHFSILRKGEPYVSPKNPGEHVLYEHPGVRRKVFYPNRQNPTLCPLQILEEEKAMRPSDPSCPSCLFLCIKYGGRTRNLPQDEYVRQRMGRNKLKSFGPLMSQMALLVHIRSGSFFFKALGITLLFMAGFPDDLVQQETKYRNLDLLQKYYRTDEQAEGEDLFHPYPMLYDIANPNSQKFAGKTVSTKSSAKKQTASTSKPQNWPRSPILPSVPSTPVPPTQFGLMGYTSIHSHEMTSFQSMPSHTLTDTLSISNPAITSSNPNVSFHTNQTLHPYPMFPPHPANAFMPITYWPHTNAFPSCPYPSSYAYRSFPHSANYISLQPQPYYSLPSCSPFISKVPEGTAKKDTALEGADSDSDSSSSSTEPKN